MARKSVKFRKIADLTNDLRKNHGLTQAELGKGLGYGNAQFISNLERGVCSLPRKKIKKYCKLLKIDKETVIETMVNDYRVRLQKA